MVMNILVRSSRYISTRSLGQQCKRKDAFMVIGNILKFEVVFSRQPVQINCFSRRMISTTLPRSITSSRYGPYTSPEPKPFFTRGRVILFGFFVIAGLVYALFPSHNYPKEVADLIRLALRAEHEFGDSDNHERALKLFFAALHVAQEMDMDRTSDEYTGLQIKIGEILEKAGEQKDAMILYGDLLQNGFIWLQEDPRRVGTMSEDKILRYLRVSVRIAEISEDIGRESDVLLILGMWIETMQSRLPEPYLKIISSPQLLQLKDEPLPLQFYHIPEAFSPEELKDLKHVDPDIEDTLVLSRDFYATLLLKTARHGPSGRIKMENVRLLQLMEASMPRILRSVVDIGAAYYLAYESSDLKASDEPNSLDVKKYHNNAQTYLSISQQCFQDVIDRIVKIRSSTMDIRNFSEEDMEDLDVAQSLATFGLGVIENKRKNYEAAMDLLKEAKTRANGLQFSELANMVKEELQRLADNMNHDKIMDRERLAEAISYVGPIIDSADDDNSKSIT
ncbi:hypothetical protein V1511DRAFT_496467 [Dipodascopsis uninucleata]